MIKAYPTPLGRWWWKTFCKLGMKLFFERVVVELPTEPLDPSRSVLMMGNHISWWDGFWANYLNFTHLHREYYVMMLETELRKRNWLRYGGSYSVQPGTRSVVDSIRYTLELLQAPRNLVLIYPQGRIHSLYDETFVFEAGVQSILDRVGERTQVLFYAAHIDFFSAARPSLFLRLDRMENLQGKDLELAYKEFYERMKRKQLGLGL